MSLSVLDREVIEVVANRVIDIVELANKSRTSAVIQFNGNWITVTGPGINVEFPLGASEQYAKTRVTHFLDRLESLEDSLKRQIEMNDRNQQIIEKLKAVLSPEELARVQLAAPGGDSKWEDSSSDYSWDSSNC